MLNFVYNYYCSSNIYELGLSYKLSNISDLFGTTISNLWTKSFLIPFSWMDT